MDEVAEYRRRYDKIAKVARYAENHVRSQLNGVLLIDRISARAKDPDHFAEKAMRRNEDDSLKYQAPLTEIQDQIGVRVVVFYSDVVDVVTSEVQRYFRSIEDKELVPESTWEFGYFGRHHVLAVPRDVIPTEISPEVVPRFFELQIKTLFQHAWSEAEHDIGYKSQRSLSPDQERLLAFASAQAWGADQAFNALRAGSQKRP